MAKSLRALIEHGLRRGMPSRAGFSRRQFLGAAVRTGAGLGAAMLMPGCAGRWGSDSSGADRPRRVAVVGGGFGGLACAVSMLDAGIEPIVFEASDRVGGRVWTDRSFIAGKTVERGGEFIGPAIHTTWAAMAQRFGLELYEPQPLEGDTAILLDGRLIRGAEADRLFEQVDAALAALIERARHVDPVRPYQSTGAALLDSRSFAEFVNSLQIEDATRRVLLSTAETDDGVDPANMSLLAYLSMVAGGRFADFYQLAESHKLSGGNDQLAWAMARHLDGRVHLNTPIESIARTKSGAVVRTSGGQETTADAVVLAVPPSVWSAIQVTPPLPANLRPQMGRNVKLLLRLKGRAWESTGLSADLSGNGLVGLTWLSTRDPQDAPHGMTVFSGGRHADELRQMPMNERPRAAIASLKPAFPDLADAVTAHRFVDWPGMMRARASYSFPAPGQVTAFGPTLVDGITTDGLAPLHFAGEHTSYAFPGYMEGALSSGVRVARALATTGAAAQQ